MGVALPVEVHNSVIASQPVRTPLLLALLYADAPWRSSRRGGALRLRWEALADRVIDSGRRPTERCATAPDYALEQLADIRQEMEPIGNLDGVGRTLANSVGIGAGTIAADHLDAVVLPGPHNTIPLSALASRCWSRSRSRIRRTPSTVCACRAWE